MDTKELVDLAAERLGGSVLYATDDFFAPKGNLLKTEKPVSKEHEYTDRGKWMDGWESRRKRTSGHDFAVVRLGVPGVIRGVLVDTSYFRGNFPSHCSVEAAALAPETDLDSVLKAEWRGCACTARWYPNGIAKADCRMSSISPRSSTPDKC